LSFLLDGRIILVRTESFVNNCVEDAVSFDGFGAGVRQYRESDASLPAEIG
jgi:hypothetical protein